MNSPAPSSSGVTHALDLPMKGARNYVHGTDMYQAIHDRFADTYPDSALRLTLHSMLCSQPDLVVYPLRSLPERPPEACAEFLLGQVGGWFLPSSRTLEARVPYDEDLVVHCASFSGNSATLVREPDTLSPIESLVALTKQLHISRSPRIAGWLFVRLDLLRPFRRPDLTGLRVRIVQRVGERLTRCAIDSRGADLGNIFFGARPA